MKATKTPIHAVTTWLRRQPPKMKVFLAVLSGIVALLFLRMVVHDHDNLFVAAEFVHALGISLLIYKFAQEKNMCRYHLFQSYRIPFLKRHSYPFLFNNLPSLVSFRALSLSLSQKPK